MIDRLKSILRAGGMMARRNKSKRNKQTRAKEGAKIAVNLLGPTPEQMARDTFEEHRIAEGGNITRRTYHKKVRQLEALQKAEILEPGEIGALYVYRLYADLIDGSETRDSLAQMQPRGPGRDVIPAAIVDARRRVNHFTDAAGSLAAILKAVIVRDVSLSQWAIEQAGAVEERRLIGLRTVVVVKPRRQALAQARIDIKMAARRIQAELEAQRHYA